MLLLVLCLNRQTFLESTIITRELRIQLVQAQDKKYCLLLFLFLSLTSFANRFMVSWQVHRCPKLQIAAVHTLMSPSGKIQHITSQTKTMCEICLRLTIKTLEQH